MPTVTEESGRPARALTLSVVPAGAAAVVTVEGEMDLLTARDLLAMVDDVQARGQHPLVIIDLSGVGFLGSAGLGVLAELATRAIGSGGKVTPVALRVVAPPDHDPVTRPWRVMNMQPILPLFPTVESALRGEG